MCPHRNTYKEDQGQEVEQDPHEDDQGKAHDLQGGLGQARDTQEGAGGEEHDPQEEAQGQDQDLQGHQGQTKGSLGGAGQPQPAGEEAGGVSCNTSMQNRLATPKVWATQGGIGPNEI